MTDLLSHLFVFAAGAAVALVGRRFARPSPAAQPGPAGVRAGEERLRLALAGGRKGTWDWDMLTGAVVWSDGHYRLWGRPPTDGPVEYGTWLAGIHPDDRPAAEADLRRAVDAGEEYRSEYRVRLPDASERWIAGAGACLYAGGKAVRMVGVVEDVTDRKQAELAAARRLERLAVQQQLVARLAADTDAPDLQPLCRWLTAALADLYQAERVNVWLFERDETELVCVDNFVRSAGRHETGQVLSGDQYAAEYAALKAAAYVDAHDALTDPRTAGYVDGYLKPLGITSMLDAVIRFAGTCHGTLCIEHVGPARRWTADEIDFACVVANQLSLVIERRARAAAEARVRERERFLKALFDGSPIGVQVFAPDGTSRRLNPAHQKLLGLPTQEYGVGAFNLRTDPSTAPELVAAFDQAAGGAVAHVTDLLLDFTAPDFPWDMARRRLWIDSTFFPLRDADGRLDAVVVFNQEVSARKQAADALADRTARLQLVLDRMPIACVMADPDFRMTYWNPAAEATFGFPAAEVLGRRPADTFVPPEAAGLLAELVAELRAGREFRAVNPNRTRDDRRIWCRWYNTPLTLPDGTRIGYLAMAEDVTALRAAQAELEASHARYRLLADTMQDTVSLHAPDGRVRYISPSTVRLSGYTPDEWAELDWRSTVHPDDRPAVTASHLANLRGEKTTVRWRVLRKDGDHLWLETLATPVPGPDGSIESIVCSSRDISERKAAEADRERLEEQLRQAHKLEGIGQLAGGVAHDFNNLLTAIGGFAELLADTLPNDAHGRGMAVEIRRAAARGAALTRQLLAFGRKQILQPEILDPNAVVADLARMLARLLGEDIAFDTRLTPGVRPVRADRGQLEQVLVNLAVNARDAMPTGGVLTVETADLPADPAAGRPVPLIRITVADTGDGIPADVLPRIFEPFFTTKPVGQGTGLGLATVYGIVTQSGGRVNVSSEPGRGTRFEVELPAADEPAVGRLSGVRPWAAAPTGRTVLVVEDEEAVRALSTFVLQQAGYTVLAAADGAAALELLDRAEAVHLVLTDVVMPGMSGRELCERLADKWPDVPVGFLSGYTADTVVRHGVAEERMAFLPKPFTPDQLTAFARRLLEPEVSAVG